MDLAILGIIRVLAKIQIPGIHPPEVLTEEGFQEPAF